MEWLVGPSRVDPSMRHVANALAKAYTQAVTNYQRIHGTYPPYLYPSHVLLAEYSYIPTWGELAAKTADLAQRIDAAKAKHGIA